MMDKTIRDKTIGIALTRAQLVLLKLICKALPLITIMGGALFGYLEGHHVGHDILAAIRGLETSSFPDGRPWSFVLENMAICTAMGLTSGMALSCFGLVFLDCAVVVVEPVNRRIRDVGTKSGISGTSSKIYYQKHDLDDHNSSILQVAEKYAKIRKKEEVEIQKILPMGTKGVQAKKRGTKEIAKAREIRHAVRKSG